MEKQSFEVKISISDLWHILISKIFVIILGALIVGGGMFAYSNHTYQPVYQSVSSIYILPQFSENEQSAGSYSQMLTAAQNIVNDCKHIVKSPSTLQRVINELDLNCSTQTLSNHINISTSEESRILTITVRDTNPEQAKQIADTAATKGIERINEVTGIKQANIMELGARPTAPINSVFSLKIVAAAGATAAVIYMAYVFIFLNNDRITNPDDASEYLSLTILGVIPNEEDTQSKKKYGGYSAYRSKKYGNVYEYRAKEAPSANKEAKKEVK